MLKYHSDNTTSIEITYGDGSGEIEISHDLGYVPAYIAYMTEGLISYPLPSYFPAPFPFGTQYQQFDSYADDENITLRVKAEPAYGVWNRNFTDVYNDYYNNNWSVMAGNNDGTTASGAIRFNAVDLVKDESITSAWLRIYVGYKGAGAGNLEIQTFGIDEDDTAAFSGSPMGRTSTTAVNNQSVIVPPTTEYMGIDVKSIVEEVTARGGWSRWNALGFKIYDNSSPNDVYIHDYYNSYLEIVHSGSTTFNFRVIIFKDRIDS